MHAHFPTVFPLNENLNSLIQIFGIYVIYCFLEAARPIKNSHLTNWQRDKLVINWVSSVFNPSDMYDYFLEWIQNQPDNSKVLENFAREFEEVKDDINDKGKSRYVAKHDLPSTSALVTDRMFSWSRYKYNPKKLYYELDQVTINKLQKALGEICPVYYKQCINAMSYFWEKPPKKMNLESN